ncbi:MAG: hypothetical protein CM1200mP30_25870 [Pseudomonadota bacterium]|nr:MAG: hypothetical protein CM1200mP30_25870 [Pseudomonadota bacterium]
MSSLSKPNGVTVEQVRLWVRNGSPAMRMEPVRVGCESEKTSILQTPSANSTSKTVGCLFWGAHPNRSLPNNLFPIMPPAFIKSEFFQLLIPAGTNPLSGLLVIILLSGYASSQFDDEIVIPENVVTFNYRLEPNDPRPGEHARIIMDLDVHSGLGCVFSDSG